jgi:uncharacterized protein
LAGAWAGGLVGGSPQTRQERELNTAEGKKQPIRLSGKLIARGRALTDCLLYGSRMPEMPPVLSVRDNREMHRFEADLGDGSLGTAEYVLRPGQIVFTHTEVPPAHEGQGIGSALVRFALASARERGLKVVPVCLFFAAYIKRHVEEQDLLDPDYRDALSQG